MKTARTIFVILRGLGYGLWFFALVLFATAVVLFYAGLIVPAVTIQTIVTVWWWTFLVLGLAAISSAVWWRGFGWMFGGQAAARRGRHLGSDALDAQPTANELPAGDDWRRCPPGRVDPSGSSAMRRGAGAARCYGWASLLLGSLIALFYAVERWRGHHAWRELENELATRGENLDLRAEAPCPVADEQNAAATALIRESWSVSPRQPTRIRLLRLSELSGAPGRGRWELGEPADLSGCLKHCAQALDKASPTTSTNPAVAFLEAWRVFEPELTELAAAAERPFMRLGLPYDRGWFGNEAVWQRVRIFRGAAQALRLRALARLSVNEADHAWEDVALMLRLAELLEQEPWLNDLRLAILRSALQPIWEGLTRGVWQDTQLIELQARLGKFDLVSQAPAALRSAMLLQIDFCERVFPARSARTDLPLDDNPQARLMLSLVWLVYPSGWSLLNQAGLYRLYQQATTTTVDPAQRRVFPATALTLQRQMHNRPPSLDPMFAIFIMPRARELMYYGCLEMAYVQTGLDLAASACAVERFRLAHGKLPDRLDALVPSLIPRVPTDLMDGQPLRYRPTSDGQFVLYAIGWNGIDDGGQAIADHRQDWDWSGSPLRREQGDWVWAPPRARIP
jgi:hypothetical protein